MNKTPEMIRMEADLKASEALREKFDAAMNRIAEAGEAQSDGEIFEKAAAELGYQVTAAELERVSAANEEISPDEMEQAAGGKYFEPGGGGSKIDSDGHEEICLAAWHCYAAMMHTKANKGNENVRCWSDYLCILLNKHKD